MKSSFAITISTTWRRVRPSVLVNWTNNSPNMNASALAASKTSSLDSTFIPPGSSIFKIARAFLAVVFLT
ncbi:MAG: hypothetical protein LDL39_11435, partial [Magnetospirillum sp.]|nr:hypothetical protein [Magnetospirillum sp.]